MRVRSIRSLKSGQPVHARINLTPRGGTPLAPALWWIMKQLLFAREQRKMLLVLTDGQPHDIYSTKKDVDISNKIFLDVYFLWMLVISIGDFLPDTSRVICRLEELPAMLFELLHDVLTRKSRPCL